RVVLASGRARGDGDLLGEAFLAVRTEAQHDSELPRPAHNQLMENANFLIVEDSPTMRQLISFSLKRFKNARIIEAVDGVDALKKLSGPDKIDLILTDINMPVMDGLKLVSLVRQNAQLKSIPIIIITTEGAEEDRERGLALGANAYISKPIQSSHLIKTISELLAV